MGGLEHYWHPVGWSGDLGGGPMATVLLGQRVVVWRTADGSAVAAHDVCPHRGTALSLGQVNTEGGLVCPYHGWTFSPEGPCTSMPQLAEGSRLPPRARLATLRCAERYGLLWVCLAEPLADIPAFPEWDDPAYRHVPCDAYTWQCGAGRMVENFTDFGHLGYLHDGLLGTRDDLVVPPHRVEDDVAGELRYRLTMAVPNTNDEYAVTAVDGALGLQTNTYVLTLPYTIHLQCRYEDTGANRTLYFAVQPRGPFESTGYCYQSRDFDLEGEDQPYVAFQAVLAEQDRPIVESQLPHEVPLAPTAEVQLPFDRVAVAYRRALARVLEAGTTRSGGVDVVPSPEPAYEGSA